MMCKTFNLFLAFWSQHLRFDGKWR